MCACAQVVNVDSVSVSLFNVEKRYKRGFLHKTKITRKMCMNEKKKMALTARPKVVPHVCQRNASLNMAQAVTWSCYGNTQ